MTTGDVVYSLRFFTHQSAEPEPGFELRSTAAESSMLTARLHMLYNMHVISYYIHIIVLLSYAAVISSHPMSSIICIIIL